MRQFLRDNGLSVTLFCLFLISLVGQALTGWRAHAEELRIHELPAVGFAAYLGSGHFISAVFENWESEFLQMAAYVLLTIFLFQKGASEFKKPDEHNPEDESPSAHRSDPDAPWPVHRGGLLLKLYSHSLSIALVTLFLVSFWLHLAGSTRRMNEEALEHRQPPQTMVETPRRRRSSGTRASRTGRASSCRSACCWCSASTCGSAARRSPSPWLRLTTRPGTDAGAVDRSQVCGLCIAGWE